MQDTGSLLTSSKDLFYFDKKRRLYVLPELACIGYDEKSFQNLRQVAEKIDCSKSREENEEGSYSFKVFSDLAKEHNCFISFSTALVHLEKGLEGGEEEFFTISNVVVNERGEIASIYNKIHVCNFGGLFFPPLKLLKVDSLSCRLCRVQLL